MKALKDLRSLQAEYITTITKPPDSDFNYPRYYQNLERIGFTNCALLVWILLGIAKLELSWDELVDRCIVEEVTNPNRVEAERDVDQCLSNLVFGDLVDMQKVVDLGLAKGKNTIKIVDELTGKQLLEARRREDEAKRLHLNEKLNTLEIKRLEKLREKIKPKKVPEEKVPEEKVPEEKKADDKAKAENPADASYIIGIP